MMPPPKQPIKILRPAIGWFLLFYTGRWEQEQIISLMLAHAQAERMVPMGHIFRPG